jgi:DNA-binding XRE family transcriptional regulator
MNIARGICLRRESSGLTRGQLAELVGTDEATIKRYETGEVTPSLPMAATIAYTFQCSVVDMADSARRRLSGPWWACWQTFQDGDEVISPQPVHLDQQGDEVTIVARERAVPVVGTDGDTWRGTLRLWDRKALTGWYLTGGSAPSRGSLYLTVNEPDGHLTGRWMGARGDGPIQSGWGALARDEDASVLLMNELRRTPVGIGS